MILTPRELKNKYNLSNSKLSYFLHRDNRTIERYLAIEDVFEISPQISMYCFLLDYFWENEGITPLQQFHISPKIALEIEKRHLVRTFQK